MPKLKNDAINLSPSKKLKKKTHFRTSKGFPPLEIQFLNSIVNFISFSVTFST